MLLPSPRGNSCQGSLYLAKKKSSSGDEIPVTALSSKETSPGEVNPNIDDEDTEEEIKELVKR